MNHQFGWLIVYFHWSVWRLILHPVCITTFLLHNAHTHTQTPSYVLIQDVNKTWNYQDIIIINHVKVAWFHLIHSPYSHLKSQMLNSIVNFTCGTAQSAWRGSQRTEQEQSQLSVWITNRGALQQNPRKCLLHYTGIHEIGEL